MINLTYDALKIKTKRLIKILKSWIKRKIKYVWLILQGEVDFNLISALLFLYILEMLFSWRIDKFIDLTQCCNLFAFFKHQNKYPTSHLLLLNWTYITQESYSTFSKKVSLTPIGP